MNQSGKWPNGICNWSLRTEIADVVEAMRALSVTNVHLGIAPNTCWQRNRDLFFEALTLTHDLGVDLLTFHLGFIDGRDQAYFQKLIDRTRCLADKAAEQEVTLALETGQESAAELDTFLERLDHPQVGINFDPGNMILYDKGDPIEALRLLGPRVKHCHIIKDALYTKHPGTWGTEVPWGQGQVETDTFLQPLTEIGSQGALAIGRESGDNQLGDIRTAIGHLTGN